MRERLLELFALAALVWGGFPLFGQHPNLVPNAGFDDSSEFGYTDYDFVTCQGCLGGNAGSGKLAIGDNSTFYHTGYFPCTGHGGAGNFLVVNGDGGDGAWNHPNGTPSDKKVLRYTIPVQPNIYYDFSFWATHLCDGNIVIGTARVDFKVKFNNVTMGSNWAPQYVGNTAFWDQFPTCRWLSGSQTQVEVCIYDDCPWTSDYGDDFGMDDVSFRMAPEYEVAAESFQVSCCNGQPFSIHVLEHCTFNEPVNQPTVPVSVEIAEEAQNGTTTLDGNDIIFTPDAGFVGTDHIRFRVTKYGLSAEAVVTIQVNGKPSDIEISGIPVDHLCVSDFSGFSPSAYCNENGSALIGSGWEYALNPDGSWSALGLDPFNLAPNDYWIRFWAENDCGRSYGDSLLLRVCDAPVLNTLSVSNPPIICEGAWLPADYLAQVEVVSWNNDIGMAGWDVKHGEDDWLPLAETTLLDGDLLRYRAVNGCNEVVTQEVTIHVTQGPAFSGEAYPNPFDPYYCLGATLNMPGDHPQYETHGMATIGFWAYLDGIDYQRIEGTPTLTEEWNDRRVTYVLDSDCGGLIPYSESFVLTVVGLPMVTVSVDVETVCVDTPIDVAVSVDWHHGTPDVNQCSWQYALPAEPTVFYDFDPNEGIPDEGIYLISYHAVAEECGFEAHGEPISVAVIAAGDQWLPEISVCDYYMLPSGDIVTESQVLDSVSNEPCPHTVFQPIVIRHGDTVPEVRSTCRDEFVWHDSVFYRADETQFAYWDTINDDGCPRLVELQLTFGDYDSYTYQETACDAYVWEMKPDLVYSESTQDTVFVPAVGDEDCDKWYYLDLTVGHSSEQTIDTLACTPFSWYGHWCSQPDSTYSYTFILPEGCDSTVHLHLAKAETINQIRMRCDTAIINGMLYDYPVEKLVINTDTLHAQNGCDSVYYKITLTIRSSENIGRIQGDSMVYVATNMLSGVYRYEIDTAGIMGDVGWSLSHPDWIMLDTDPTSCRILVTTLGHAELKASFMTAQCGELERKFNLHAGFFDVDESLPLEVKVYPNPTRGTVTVEAEHLQRVRIADMMGQTLRQEGRFDSDRLTVDLKGFAPSIYLLEVQTEKGRVMRRIVLYE